MRSRWLGAALVALSIGCGKSSAPPTTPSPAPAPAPQPTPPARPPVTLTGIVTSTNDGHPLAGANVAVGQVSTTTDNSGGYSVTLPADSPATLSYVVSGNMLVPHAGALIGGISRTVNLDAIVQDGLFDLAVYRTLVRGPNQSRLFRWTTNPNVFVHTADQTTGRAVEPEVVALVSDWAQRSVAMWSGGQLHVTTLETGATVSRNVPGWIVVDFTRDLSSNFCGGSVPIAANPGNVTFNIDRCGCGSEKVPPGLVVHQFGHAMGFWDSNDPRSVMFNIIPGGCPQPVLSPAEKLTAAIAYHRAVGNADPDIDPDSSAFIAPTFRMR
jgi:hypothetical protein